MGQRKKARGNRHQARGEEDVVRRFGRSKSNFWNIYKNSVDSWKIYFGVEENFVPVAFGEKNRYDIVNDELFGSFLDSLGSGRL